MIFVVVEKGEVMAEYHVGCGMFSIYAGTLKKNGIEWLHKSDVKDEALSAVAQYLLINEKEFRFVYDGKEYALKVEEKCDSND